jgi:hypothetical protein
VACGRNSITRSTETLRKTVKTLAQKVPADAEPSADSTFPSVSDQVGDLRAPFAQNADGSHFALTVLFQAGRIGLDRRWALRNRSDVSVYASPTEDSAHMTSADDVMVFIIYHH